MAFGVVRVAFWSGSRFCGDDSISEYWWNFGRTAVQFGAVNEK